MEVTKTFAAVITVLFLLTVGVTLYTSAVTYSGATSSPTFALGAKVNNYTADMNTTTNTLSTSVQKMTDATVTIDPLSFIGSLTNAAFSSVLLVFKTLTMLVDMIGTSMIDLLGFGVPGWMPIFGIMIISIGVIVAVLSALLKWNI
jgi:hypothetical protein